MSAALFPPELCSTPFSFFFGERAAWARGVPERPRPHRVPPFFVGSFYEPVGPVRWRLPQDAASGAPVREHLFPFFLSPAPAKSAAVLSTVDGPEPFSSFKPAERGFPFQRMTVLRYGFSTDQAFFLSWPPARLPFAGERGSLGARFRTHGVLAR